MNASQELETLIQTSGDSLVCNPRGPINSSALVSPFSPAEDAHTVGIIEVPVAGRPLAAAILPCFPTAAIPGSF
jgi:hypothetical protein